MDVANATTLASTLEVQNDASLNTALSVGGAVSLDSTLKVTQDSSFNSNMYIDGIITLSGDLIPAHGNVSNLGSASKPFGSLYISNNTINFAGATSEDAGSLSFKQGGLEVQASGAQEIQQLLAVVDNKVAIGKASQNATTNLDVSGTMWVTDDVSLNSNLYVGGDLSLNGDLTIQGNLGVFQTTNTKTINTTVNNYEVIVSNDLSINGDVSISGATTMDSTLNVDGNATVNKLISNTNVSSAYDQDSRSFFGRSMIGGINDEAQWNHIAWSWNSSNWALRHTRGGRLQLNTRGGQEMWFMIGASRRMVMNSSGNFGINNNSPTAKLHVGGTFIASGAATLQNTLAVSNATTLSSTLSVANAASLNSTLAVTGDTTLGSKLVVSGDASFNGDLTIAGNLEVYQQQNTSVINTTVNNYQVIVTNDLSLNGNLTLDGDASFNNNVNIVGAATLDSTLRVGNYMGINTDPNNNIVLDISASNAVRLPKGQNADRPVQNGAAASYKGLIRYNSEQDQFEGFGAGNAWGSLGGVKDVDQDTYITAETSAGTDNDQLQFYTAGYQRFIVDATGDASFNYNVNVVGATTLESTLRVGNYMGINTDPSSGIVLDISASNAMRIPKGQDADRPIPDGASSDYKGLIRYNTEQDRFEGFGSGNAWAALGGGGVADGDADTYITAELTSGADDDALRFYTAGSQNMIIESTGDASFNGNVTVATVNSTQTIQF